jgi:hypothetical protein
MAKNTPGAGLSVHANVSKALGPRYSSDCPVYHLGNDSCTMAIAYELWTQFPREEWDAMQQANARLIASAPELLAFAQSVANVLQDAQRQDLHLDEDKQQFLNDALAVVAKAQQGGSK